MSQQPPPIDYSRPRPVEPLPHVNRAKRYFLAVLIGTAVSGLAWALGFHASNPSGNGIVALMVILPGIKLLTGITLLCFRGWRSAGAGVITSIALGFLIFFGM